MPEPLVGAAAVGTVSAEAALAAGAWLPMPAVLNVVFAMALLLLALFTRVLVRAIRRGTDASCSCFGVSTTPIGWPQVVRNSALILIAAAGLAAGMAGADGYPPPRLWPAPALAALLLAVLVWASDTLAAALRD